LPIIVAAFKIEIPIDAKSLRVRKGLAPASQLETLNLKPETRVE
jgi:hypothetical protein